MRPPEYFEPIRTRAANRWRQLEQDHELAGPWHQLFKQVQSPRHVLSELLQNADDAGATEASAEIIDDAFVFRHNGADFTEENFASLCRFGYSNKRALHTIGFRGIGFKSTFSLGDVVELTTPTLLVKFHRKRFTEPVWAPRSNGAQPLTEVRVSIADAHRGRELRKNLEEWGTSAVSLLFFRNLRTLRLLSSTVAWRKQGRGPIPDTEWMTSGADDAQKFLVARSKEEAFPPECLHEIRQERLLEDSEGADFPPCRVELVLGASGRLFVVLPTGVETKLPFACNAPFIQDPARVKIKDPEISPTNRWLLERVGKLAAEIMVQWVAGRSLSIEDRAKAYALLPDVDRDDSSLQGSCGRIAEEAFEVHLGESQVVLTEGGSLASQGVAVAVPDVLLDVWTAKQVSSLLTGGVSPIMARVVATSHCEKLVRWNLVQSVGKPELLAALLKTSPPKPEKWQSLLVLWAYVAPDLSGYGGFYRKRELRIVPVQGSNDLHDAEHVARLGDKRLLQSDGDWEFLAEHLLVMNPNWPRYLGKERLAAEAEKNVTLVRQVGLANDVLGAIALEEASDVSGLIDLVAAAVFGREGVLIADCVRVAHIAAKLGATAGPAFNYVTQDAHLRSTTDVLLNDPTGDLKDLLPEDWANAHLLHQDYAAVGKSCSGVEWRDWVNSERSGVRLFVPLMETPRHIYGQKDLDKELRERGHSGAVTIHFQTSRFEIADWDFDPEVWRYWEKLSASDSTLWGRVLTQIMLQPKTYWESCSEARVVQISNKYTRRVITDAPLTPAWVRRLSQLKCLPDTRGTLHIPADLLRRTPLTEPLLDVESFVRHDFDTEATRRLLILLGVRDIPTGPDRMLACLKALSASKQPPILEVEKWYRRLDQLIQSSSTEDSTKIATAFRDQRLVLSEQGAWCSTGAIFLFPDEDGAPDASVIRASVRDLNLWSRVGVSDRPTADLAIAWLKSLPSGAALSADDLKRVRGILSRHPGRVWHECGHWLNLAGEWVPVGQLQLRLTMQALVPWTHLHLQVKQRVADFQRLPVDVIDSVSFSVLPSLAAQVEERLNGQVAAGAAEPKPWLRRLGIELTRLELNNDGSTASARATAARLANTNWRTAESLEVIPYIEGIPAGTPRRVEAAWIERTLYVEDRPLAHVALAVAKELARAFELGPIEDAIKLCFERPEDFVSEYLEQHFSLAPVEAGVGPDATSRPGEDGEVPSPNEEGAKEAPTEPNPVPDGTIDPTAAGQAENPASLDSEEAEKESDVPVSEEDAPKPAPPPKPARPSLVERFAASQGFRKGGDARFVHANGVLMCKSPDNPSLWERRAPDGTVLRYYSFKDHCLQATPLEVDAALWGLIDRFPSLYSLVLATPEGYPFEYTGAALKALQDDGGLKLFPAAYRLVYDHETSEVK